MKRSRDMIDCFMEIAYWAVTVLFGIAVIAVLLLVALEK